MNIPASTYRIQFHKEFTFNDLTVILDYLHTLGITTIYAAPILQATPGSMHGYDVIDPHRINPEIGTLEELEAIVQKLRRHNMSWVQDIVPNHMAFNTLNARLMDVLERGPSSPYYTYFDIDWEHPDPDLHGKLMVPFLGSELTDCVSRKEVRLAWSGQGFVIAYGNTYYPVSLTAYEYIFAQENSDIDWRSFLSEATKAKNLAEYRAIKERFIDGITEDSGRNSLVESVAEKVNDDPKRLGDILDHQFYRLAFWKQTEERINYRRFFTVNELICLRMEDDAVFDEYHRLLYDLYKRDLIQGLRIDHIDGLQDPARYVKKLRALFGDTCYIIAEKILEEKEAMPAWPLQGTSGYEFLSHIGQLVTDRKGARQLLELYRELVPDVPSYRELVLRNKRLILTRYMAGEWNNLARMLNAPSLAGQFRPERLKEALASLMISLPVYRIYPDTIPLHGDDLNVMRESITRAMSIGKEYQAELEHFSKLFQGEAGTHDDVLRFLKRLMQFTGPLTAKGVEDTTFYIYHPLVSHDEVGDTPSTLGISVTSFHQKMMRRRQETPLSLNATATHDTKRGEDARLRLNALTTQPQQWKDLVTQWISMNRDLHTRTSKGMLAPSVNDEYYLYQSIVGSMPVNDGEAASWMQRLHTSQQKALREAKVHSDWADPDTEYEEGCARFARDILRPGSTFQESLHPFLDDVIREAGRQSLTQTLIKITAPGIPDIYQGCELWDLSFVDPDNRRPVDYLTRMALLDELREAEKKGFASLLEFLEAHRAEGAQKLFVTWKALTFRRSQAALFREGRYIPLQTTWKESNLVGFARTDGECWALVVAPLQMINDLPDEEIILPPDSPARWKNILTGEAIDGKDRLRIREVLGKFSVALLTNIEK